MDLDQQFFGLQSGARDVGEPDLRRLAIAFEGECFHGASEGYLVNCSPRIGELGAVMMTIIIIKVKALMTNIINVKSGTGQASDPTEHPP